MPAPITCPLCKSTADKFVAKDSARIYLTCKICHLIFVPPQFHLSPAAKRSRYDLHQNDASDQKYRGFLGLLANPLIALLKPGMAGLDFGSGPGPTLSVMLTEAGMKMEIFDKFYADNFAVFQKQYDFISASEVFEHLADPQMEIERLWRCLKPNGYLAVMTQMRLAEISFESWRYKDDDTHLSFFSHDTVRWLTKSLGAELVYLAPNVFILRKA